MQTCDVHHVLFDELQEREKVRADSGRTHDLGRVSAHVEIDLAILAILVVDVVACNVERVSPDTALAFDDDIILLLLHLFHSTTVDTIVSQLERTQVEPKRMSVRSAGSRLPSQGDERKLVTLVERPYASVEQCVVRTNDVAAFGVLIGRFLPVLVYDGCMAALIGTVEACRSWLRPTHAGTGCAVQIRVHIPCALSCGRVGLYLLASFSVVVHKPRHRLDGRMDHPSHLMVLLRMRVNVDVEAGNDLFFHITYRQPFVSGYVAHHVEVRHDLLGLGVPPDLDKTGARNACPTHAFLGLGFPVKLAGEMTCNQVGFIGSSLVLLRRGQRHGHGIRSNLRQLADNAVDKRAHLVDRDVPVRLVGILQARQVASLAVDSIPLTPFEECKCLHPFKFHFVPRPVADLKHLAYVLANLLGFFLVLVRADLPVLLFVVDAKLCVVVQQKADRIFRPRGSAI